MVDKSLIVTIGNPCVVNPYIIVDNPCIMIDNPCTVLSYEYQMIPKMQRAHRRMRLF